VNIVDYLDRLAYAGPREPSAATLHGLHEAHMLAVPFENLDIGLGRTIALDLDALFDKIVRRRRGGFCYELNGLFAELLGALGFDVTRLSARVYNDGQPGPEFDHLALLVRSPDASLWLADVGFGDCFVRPLPFAEGEHTHAERQRTYRLTATGDEWQLAERRGAGPWELVYGFTRQPRQLTDFAAMCHWQQTAPESHFTQRRVCSRATPTGRVTLRERALIITHGDERVEHALPDDNAVAAALREHFGIEAP
jgi:N-hydroxyarylamine O-acetyltransferase